MRGHRYSLSPTAGTIEGTGEYHLGEQCTLTAVPAENSRFNYWKKDDKIVSNPSITLDVINDIDNYKAFFTFKPVKEIVASHAPDTNNVYSPYVSLSWDFDNFHNWTFLKKFDLNGEKMVTLCGEQIYTAYRSYDGYPYTFGRYTLDGELVEFYNNDINPSSLTSDGQYLYCSNNSAYLHCYDLTLMTPIESTDMNMVFAKCAYDADSDGFWLNHGSSYILVNRQGQKLYDCAPASVVSEIINGFGSIIAEDGNSHLLICGYDRVYAYDTSSNSYNNIPYFLDYGFFLGASFGKYNGKDAFIFAVNDTLRIYEIPNTNAQITQITGYRLYRADSEGNMVMLADNINGSDYIDNTWNDALAGMYRFGISTVYANGVESEIIWSDFIEKTDYDVGESHDDPTNASVQKVFENGQIIIIKDGKRYNVSGQELN